MATTITGHGSLAFGADTGVQPPCVPQLIRRRAYELYEAHGRDPNHELEDWLQAEREVKRHLGVSNSVDQHS
jgi:hypothetical protein